MIIIIRCIKDILQYWTECRTVVVFVAMIVCISGIIYWESLRRKGVGNISLRSFLPKLILWIIDSMYFTYAFYVTLGMRHIGQRREVSLLPFYGLVANPAEIPLMVENILLFIPYGILLPLTCNRLRKRKTLLQSAFIVSFMIELLQYIFSCGKTEIDDCILNCLGAAVGYVIYVVYFTLRRICKPLDVK